MESDLDEVFQQLQIRISDYFDPLEVSGYSGVFQVLMSFSDLVSYFHSCDVSPFYKNEFRQNGKLDGALLKLMHISSL